MEKVYPKITCVVPTYKRPDYLKRALESIARQTYPPTEVIVADNFPTDQTAQIVRDFGANGLSIRHITHHKTIPAFDNWLSGFLEVKTEWTNIVWDDDWLEPNCLEQLSRIQVVTDADVVLSGARGHVHGIEYLWYQQPEMTSESFIALFPNICRRMYPNSPLAGIQKTEDVVNAMTKLEYPKGAITHNLVVGPDLAICIWGLARGGRLSFSPLPLVNMFGDGENMTLLHEKILPKFYAKTLREIANHFGYKLTIRNKLMLLSMGSSRISPNRLLGRMIYNFGKENQ